MKKRTVSDCSIMQKYLKQVFERIQLLLKFSQLNRKSIPKCRCSVTKSTASKVSFGNVNMKTERKGTSERSGCNLESEWIRTIFRFAYCNCFVCLWGKLESYIAKLCYIPPTILLPSARCISPDSTRVFKMHVTFVGALSASSTIRIWPCLTARTSGESS